MNIGWVDFSSEARKQARDALAALEEKGAVDELGIGILRDAFAAALFPGTSTIQTRAKYFALVPCCVRLALKTTKGRIRAELREIEKKCCAQMWKECGYDEKARVIGMRNVKRGDWILRTPSEIYWVGLRTMGILRTDTPRGVWLAHAARLAMESGGVGKRGTQREEGVEDDEDTHLSGWLGDWELPGEVYRHFSRAYEKEVLSPDLTPDEAAFLRERILSAEGTKDSLLAWCLKNGVPDGMGDERAASEGQSPFGRFARSIRHHVTGPIAEWIDLALAFNRLVFPAKVLYNKMLDVPGLPVSAANLWRRIEPRIPEWMDSIDLGTIFARCGLPPLHPLARFLTSLREVFRMADFATAEKLIEKRETDIKRKVRAKLNHREKVEPGTWVGGGWLDYRLGIASRILRDIKAAEGDAHV